MEPTPAPQPARPLPLPYQRETVRFLKAEEPDLWKWFAASRARPEHAEAVRLDLLKSTYRIEPATQPKLYAFADEVLAAFGSKAPITIYQAQTGGGLNAFLAHVPGEAHVVLAGPVLSVLGEAELRALLGHELSHFLLFQEWDQEFLIAADLLRALASDAGAAPAQLESDRLFTLYAEVFADRGAFLASQHINAALSTLIKMETGLTEVSPESYLRQADEILQKSSAPADQLTHPETYLRARALNLWATRGDEALPEIERMIEGPLALGKLDLLRQRTVAGTTRRLITQLLAPGWFRSDTTLAHARLFFEDFPPSGLAPADARLRDDVQNSDPALQDYYCYVLLDFVVVDRDLGDVALAAALSLSRKLGLGDRFVPIALKELAISKKQFAKIEREADDILARAGQEAGAQT